MKKLICILCTAVLIMILPLTVSADFKASFTLTGPESVRPGDSFTVRFKADGNGICGLLAEITYDPSVITFRSSSDTLADWRVEVTESSGKLQIWAEENNSFKSPVNSQKTLVSLSFRLSSSAKTGERIKISADIQQVSDTENELSGLSASYSATVARPLSGNSKLRSLSVDGYDLIPAFSPSVKEYEISGEVEYTLNSLKINAVTDDEEASVDISGARLSVGANTVRVKITAENGDSTVYTIKAKMKQDPDYVASSNAYLSGITVSEGKISPAFDREIFDYILYVPYETEKVGVSGKASDPKAKADAAGPDELTVGDNIYTVSCTAEDGSVNEYRLTVVRMPRYDTDTETDTGTETVYDTETDEVSDTETETETEEETETDTVTSFETDTDTETDEPVRDDTSDDTAVTSDDPVSPTGSVPLWIVFAAAAGGIVVGALGAVLVSISLKERK